jgi:uncharacterized protein YndB with AHSA1/START domain
MTRIAETIETGLSPETAFAYVADFAHQAEWDPNTRSSRRTDEGPLGRGARFALEVAVGGRTAPMEYRITEFDPPHRVVLVGEGSGVWSSDEISFTPLPDGSRIEYVAEIRLQGLLGLIQPLLGRAFAKIGRGAADGMRSALERQAREPATP